MKTTQTNRVFRFAAHSIAVAGLAAVMFAARPANAEHRSFRVSGPLCGCHGEAHLVEALEHINHAFETDCPVTRIRESQLARVEVRQASIEVCDPTAREMLDDASFHLVRFASTGRVHELAAAGEAIVAAVDIEQQIHRRVVARPILGGKSFCFAGAPCGFHGEDELIDALQHLDNAFRATCDRDRIVEAVYARQDVTRAYRDVCRHDARRALLSAIQSLAMYQVRGQECDADVASQLILKAMDIEQTAHAVHHHPHQSDVLVPSSRIGNSHPRSPWYGDSRIDDRHNGSPVRIQPVGGAGRNGAIEFQIGGIGVSLGNRTPGFRF